MMLLKMGMWIKGWKANGSNNGARAMLSLSEGEFRGEVRLLLENQLELIDKMHEAQVSDRKCWGPAITELVKSMHQFHKDREQDRATWAPGLTQILTLQQSTADMLDKHTKMLVSHDEHEREVWQQMLVAIESFQIDTHNARESCMQHMDNMKEELLATGN